MPGWRFPVHLGRWGISSSSLPLHAAALAAPGRASAPQGTRLLSPRRHFTFHRSGRCGLCDHPVCACCLKLIELAARRFKPSCNCTSRLPSLCAGGRIFRICFLEQVNSCRVRMSKPSRLARPLPANTAPKSPSSRKEDFNSRSRKISLGEKILRAGSEGNLVKQHQQEQVEITEVLVPRRAPFLKGNHLFHTVK